MSERDTYYLTTAIFYPSAKPALHSMFEAIGADMIARYQRLMGREVRFLTGLDEHSANVERDARQGDRSARADRPVGGDVEGHVRALRDQLRSLHPHHRSRPRRGVGRDGPPRAGQRRRLPGPVLGLVLHRLQRVQDRPAARRRPLPRPPDPRAAVAGGEQLLLPPLGLPGAPRAAVRGQPVVLRAGALPQRGPRLAEGGAARLQHQPVRRHVGHPVPRRSRPPHLRLVRRPHQLRHRRRLPERPGCVRPMVAGERARHRQEHHALPLPVLAGDAHERACRSPNRSSPTASCSTAARR